VRRTLREAQQLREQSKLDGIEGDLAKALLDKWQCLEAEATQEELRSTRLELLKAVGTDVHLKRSAVKKGS
jgi:hypothetical protein